MASGAHLGKASNALALPRATGLPVGATPSGSTPFSLRRLLIIRVGGSTRTESR